MGGKKIDCNNSNFSVMLHAWRISCNIRETAVLNQTQTFCDFLLILCPNPTKLLCLNSFFLLFRMEKRVTPAAISTAHYNVSSYSAALVATFHGRFSDCAIKLLLNFVKITKVSHCNSLWCNSCATCLRIWKEIQTRFVFSQKSMLHDIAWSHWNWWNGSLWNDFGLSIENMF